jgi:hypothetical protein
MVALTSLKMYSIGSSIVRMCTRFRSLMYWSMEAIDVDLPDPVTPANRISPWALMATSPRTGLRCRLSNVLMSEVIRRAARDGLPRAMKRLIRKRLSSS